LNLSTHHNELPLLWGEGKGTLRQSITSMSSLGVSRGGQKSGGFRFTWLLVCGAFFGLALASRAEESSKPSARFQRLYLETHRHWRQNPTNTGAAWKFARACFDWADFATNDHQRASIAEEGIAASRRAIELQPKSAAAHYYLGLNLGQLAQTKLLGALRLIGEMEAAWHRTLELDPKFDYAGAHRSLTLLYRDAPGWPTSVGNRTKARRHLQKAIALWPDYPGNQLCLLESQLKWGESKAVQSQIPAVDKILQEARAKFTGEEWARDWQEWDERWRRIKIKTGIVTTRSPRHPE
jgi:tetratricopeptide (TPR) repeat protein